MDFSVIKVPKKNNENKKKTYQNDKRSSVKNFYLIQLTYMTLISIGIKETRLEIF